MPNRRHRSRRRYSADFVEGGATFGGFEVIGGVGRAKAVWKRPDHLDAPDAEAPLGPLERLGPVGASVTAVALVAALVGGLVAGFGRSADESASARDPRPAVTEPVAAAVPQAAEAPPVPLPPAAPVTVQPPAPPPKPSRGDVVVLDQGRAPVAARALADKLTAGGWRVTGNAVWRGRVPATTVYYPAGREAEARKLAEAFPEIRRVKRSFPGITQARLVVIVVDGPGLPLPPR